MNWTEGNLARHSRGRARNKVLNRQKQYFAKARTRLLNGDVKPGPITISFLQRELDEKLSPACHSRVPTSSRHSRLQREYRQRSPRYRERLKSDNRADHALDKNSIEHLRSSSPSCLDEGVLSKQQGHSKPTQEQDSRAKRQKLLSKADWAGLSMQQPIALTFYGNNHSSTGPHWSKSVNTVSRREKVKRHIPARHRGERGHRVPERWEREVQQLKSHPIIVRIGSQDMHTVSSAHSQIAGERSNSSPSVSLSPVLASYSSRTSEPQQDIGRQNYKQDSSFKSHVLPPVPIYEHGIWKDRTGPDRSRSSSHQLDHSLQLEKPAHVVYSSSVIQEPTPRRASDLSVLQWSPSRYQSDDTGSMCVEMDKPRPRPALSQIAENENWMAFLASSEIGGGSNAIIPLTRGSSLLHSPRFRPTLSPDSDQVSGRPGTSPGSKDQRQRNTTSSDSPHLRSSLTLHDSLIDPLALAAGPENRVASPVPPCEAKEYNQLYGNVSVIGQGLPSSALGQPSTNGKSQAEVEAEENEDWMRFVFGSNNDGLEDSAFAEAAHQAACELKPLDTPRNAGEMPSSSSANRDCETVATWGSCSSPQIRASDGYPSSNSTSLSTTRCTGASDGRVDKDLVTINNESDDFVSDDAASASHMATDGSLPPANFRFAAPQLFVGRLWQRDKELPNPEPVRARAPAPVLVDGNIKRNRRRKRRKMDIDDGRADIRALPDFDGDPIEEIEGY